MKQETLDKWMYSKKRENPYEDLLKEIRKSFYVIETPEGLKYEPKDERAQELYKALKANGLEWLILLI